MPPERRPAPNPDHAGLPAPGDGERPRPAQRRLGTMVASTLRLAYRSIVCVLTFLVVFSICEGLKDLLHG